MPTNDSRLQTEVVKKAYAKINLSLDVLSKRADGYHDVSMIMHQIDLHDEVRITAEKQSGSKDVNPALRSGFPLVTLTTDNPLIPIDETNLACKAAYALFKAAAESKSPDRHPDHSHFSAHGLPLGSPLEFAHRSPLEPVPGSPHEPIPGSPHEPAPGSLHIHIHIKKRIPVAAGLAGGSTDAAAVLLGLNELLGLDFPPEQLLTIGKSLGADVPFCLTGGCALAEGIGEKLTPLSPVSLSLLLSKPDIEVSTAKVYGALNVARIQNHSDNQALREAIESLHHAQAQRLSEAVQAAHQQKMYANMNNALENVTLKAYPIVMHTKDMMAGMNASHTLMSGSGPSVFSLYPDDAALQSAYVRMRDINKETFIVKTIGSEA